MDLHEVEKVFDEHWRQGWGSVFPAEIMVMQDLIAEHRPRHFIEVGTASGLSGGFIARIMEENGGESFTTLDLFEEFFRDKSKPVGYLVERIYQGSAIRIDLRPKTTALDLPAMGREFDMAFVDANHQHPYPTLDTLCLYPFLTGPRTVIHHDLKLYKEQDVPIGIGPKYLFDQVPEAYRSSSHVQRGNLFWLSLTMPREELEALAIDSLLLPWSIRHEMRPRRIQQVREVLGAHYSTRLLDAFELALQRFNTSLAERTAVDGTADSQRRPSFLGRLLG